MTNSFKGKYDFLSNFYECSVTYEGITYPSSEHAYQAAKSLEPKVREFICKKKTPGQAKKAGKQIEIRDDWDKVKAAVMYEILKKKFRDVALKKLLLDTGNEKLVEGNRWGDTYWGVCKGKGDNILGKLLMKIRDKNVVVR